MPCVSPRKAANICSGFSLFTLLAGSSFASGPVLTQFGDTFKVEQVSGPCDWVTWDPKTPPITDANGTVSYGAPGPCGQTASQAYANEILAQGLGYSFEDTSGTGNLILLFGDTVGVKSGVQLNPDPKAKQFLQFHAKDTIARSGAQSALDVLTVDFYKRGLSGVRPLFITSGGKKSVLPPQPNGLQPYYVASGTDVAMGPFDIPTSGISLNGQTYLVVQTGVVAGANGTDYSNAYSVLVKFDGVSTFTTGRTISQSTNQRCTSTLCLVYPGNFIFTALAEMPLAWSQQLGLTEPAVLIYGNGQFRQSSLYLAYIPLSEFWSGSDSKGKPATRYFAGYKADGTTPKWVGSEFDAVPVVWDNPPLGTAPAAANPDPGTIGNASVTYDSHSGLWLMIYDGGRQIDPATQKPNEATTGIYFTYAAAPWGPWRTGQQQIYNACKAHTDNRQGFGDIIFYHTSNVSNPADNPCPAALPAGLPPHKPASAGPAGPIINSGSPDPFGPMAFTTRGGVFAPQILGRFTSLQGSPVQGAILKLFYNISTWNPYTVVMMETDFELSPQGGVR